MYPMNLLPELDLRVEKIRRAMRKANADGCLLTTPANLYYTSGRVFSGYTYISPEREVHYFVRKPVDLKGDRITYLRKPEQLPELFAGLGISLPKQLLLETDLLSFNETERLKNIFQPEKILNGSLLMRRVRAVKTPEEIRLIRESGRRHAAVYRHIPSLYEEGMSDIELSAEIERIARLQGSLGIFRVFGQSMETFTGSLLAGDNADHPSPYDFSLGGEGLDPSLPIGSNGTLIRPGMTVMVDLGGDFTGYMTDMSRVFSVGEIPKEALSAHCIALEMQEEMVKTTGPGVPASELYEKALKKASEAGMQAYFMGHRQQAAFVGHGVGIEINELPVLTARYQEPLEKGMVFAYEPKFVIPHVGAVGIENTFVVTDNGVEKLTICPEEIVSLT